MTARPPREQRGSVLLVALGILAVLSVFALSFASIVRLESRAATNVTDSVRARLAAEAGVDRALFLLTRTELADPISSFHAPWIHRSQDARTWGIGVPLDRAENPSFRSGRTPEGLAYSGVVSGTYRPGGDHFVLKVVPANAKLSLNGQQPRDTLARMLDVLGQAIEDFDAARLSAEPAEPLRDAGWAAQVAQQRAALEERGVAPGMAFDRTKPRDPIAGRGARLVDLRASLGGSFQSLDQLRAVLSAEDLERLRDHVTVDAWHDPVMVGFDASDEEVAQRRAPVDINTATWPVLVACFEGLLAGRPVHPSEAPTPIAPPQARDLATAIDLRRRGPVGEPFRGWADFTQFLEVAAAGLTLTQRAAILASADPNLIRWPRNPDGLMNPGLGKADLAYATTELCFITYGVYEITCLGRVLDPDGRLVAQHTVNTVAQVYDTLRLLTQADFESARATSEVDKTATFPNPVRAVTGSYKVEVNSDDGLEEVVFEPITPAEERRRLRIEAASKTSGWVQLVPDEPVVPKAAQGFANVIFVPPAPPDGDEGGGHNALPHHTHLFRFGPDLRGELWKFTPGNAVNVPGWDPFVVFDDGTRFIRYWIERVKEAGEPAFDVPVREGNQPFLADRAQAFAARLGAPPQVFGLKLPADRARYDALVALGASLYPPGRRAEYAEDLAPDGLLVHPDRGGDLRYVNTRPRRPESILTNWSGVYLWFKLNVSTLETWTPLLEAYTPVSGHPFVGRQDRPNGPNWFKLQVEARLLRGRPPQKERFTLEVRSRRWTEDRAGELAPLEIWNGDDPVQARSPEAIDFNRAYFERHVRHDVDPARDDARAGEWHFLYVPNYGNVHFSYLDNQAADVVRIVATDDEATAFGSWPRPAWTDELQDRFSPGGFVFPGDRRPPYATATIDEVQTTNIQFDLRPPPDQGYERTDVKALARPTARLPGYAVTTRRYDPWGPDHCGTFEAELPAFQAERVKVGRMIWTQLDPRRWGPTDYEDFDFPSQSAYRFSLDASRDHLSGRKVPRPPLRFMRDDYVRYWWLQYVDERAALLDSLTAGYVAMLPGATPASAGTFQAYIDAIAAEKAALLAEQQQVLRRFGPPRPPADAGASIAFDARAKVIQPGKAQQVLLRLDFLYFDAAQGTQAPIARDGQSWYAASVLNISPVLEDLIVPYQERPRILRRWDE